MGMLATTTGAKGCRLDHASQCLRLTSLARLGKPGLPDTLPSTNSNPPAGAHLPRLGDTRAGDASIRQVLSLS